MIPKCLLLLFSPTVIINIIIIIILMLECTSLRRAAKQHKKPCRSHRCAWAFGLIFFFLMFYFLSFVNSKFRCKSVFVIHFTICILNTNAYWRARHKHVQWKRSSSEPSSDNKQLSVEQLIQLFIVEIN